MLRVKMCCSSLTISSASLRSVLSIVLPPNVTHFFSALSKALSVRFSRRELLVLLAFPAVSKPCMHFRCAILCHLLVLEYCCLCFAPDVYKPSSCLACQELGVQCCTGCTAASAVFCRPTQRCLPCWVVFPLLWVTSQLWLLTWVPFRSASQPPRRGQSHQYR